MEPDFISQNADGLTGADAQEWFSRETAAARKRGVTHARYAVHPEHGWLLFEGWKEIPRREGELCEGEPRWQVNS